MVIMNSPNKLTLRAYQVGFGDCFLLTFHYQSALGDRHVLIDFGSNKKPKSAPADMLAAIADDIRTECGGKLHAIVLTHRHKDHIAGFATTKNKKGSGDVIASLNPELVIQPWTEDPKAKTDASKATGASESGKTSEGFIAALESMHAISAGISAEAARLAADEEIGRRKRVLSILHYLGEEGIKNPSAVANLQKMGKIHEYVNAGYATSLATLLPGVKVTVLGPPTLEQDPGIQKERSSDAEFWMFQASAGRFTAGRANLDGEEDVANADQRESRPPEPVFPKAETLSAKNPPAWARWFVPRLRRIRGDNLLQIVRILDDAMNNTSVILLFELGDQVLLFPGDAQIENWSYTLRQRKLMARLKSVTLYKVGHHGSRNATPKSLWNGFSHRGGSAKKDRLQTVMSTMGGVYGQVAENSEVPRATLLKELRAKSTLTTTQDIRGKSLKAIIEIPL
jgi:hypothetical protein